MIRLATPFALQAPLDGAPFLLVLGLLLLLGALGAALARRLRLPSVTGQILAGFLVSDHGLGLVHGKAVVAAAQPLSSFALALIAVSVGGHLDLRRLRNAERRLAWLFGLELLIVPVGVLTALLLFTDLGGPGQELGLTLAALMAALALETSPATTLAQVRDSRAAGLLTKTLLASVALANLSCLMVFELFRSAAIAVHERAATTYAEALWFALLGSGRSLLIASASALVVGFALARTQGSDTRRGRLVTLSLAALLVAIGVSEWLGASMLLAGLLLGIVQSNIDHRREQSIDRVLDDLQPAIFAIFFTLSGVKLAPGVLYQGGLIALVLFLARAGSKLLAARLAMRLAHAPESLQQHLGYARLPQAGVAIGLLLTVQREPTLAAGIDLFAAVVLGVVLLNEIIGPVLTRLALTRAGEVGRDRDRLIDFLHEENITTGFEADSPEQAIRRLSELLVESHHLPREAFDLVVGSAIERESQGSTAFGNGLMIPHAVLPAGERMLGVIGISQAGLPLPSPDKRPIHCIVLLATPADQRQRHLEIMASLARTVGLDQEFRGRLFAAASPAHAYELLNDGNLVDLNRFLEDDSS